MIERLSALSPRGRVVLAVVAVAAFVLAVGLGYQFGYWLGRH